MKKREKPQTAWSRVPKEKRGKIILYGILGAFIGYFNLILRTPDDITEEEDKKEKNK